MAPVSVSLALKIQLIGVPNTSICSSLRERKASKDHGVGLIFDSLFYSNAFKLAQKRVRGLSSVVNKKYWKRISHSHLKNLATLSFLFDIWALTAYHLRGAKKKTDGTANEKIVPIDSDS